MKERIKFVQQSLLKKKYKIGAADGIIGKKTRGALSKIKGIPTEWADSKKIVAYIQLLAQENGINSGVIDGLWGSQTQFAYDSLKYLIKHGEKEKTWRPEEIKVKDKNPNKWPKQTQSELTKFFGKVGTNQVYVELPYPHRLAWDKDTVVTRTKCNKKVHDSIKRVLTKVLKHYGIDEIKRLGLDLFGGCFNVRKKRGGTTYSTHSWGIALDYDPTNNRLKWGRDRATFAKPEYDQWWKYWEDEGWVSLGRARNFDWMHVQSAKL